MSPQQHIHGANVVHGVRPGGVHGSYRDHQLPRGEGREGREVLGVQRGPRAGGGHVHDRDRRSQGQCPTTFYYYYYYYLIRGCFTLIITYFCEKTTISETRNHLYDKSHCECCTLKKLIGAVIAARLALIRVISDHDIVK